VLASISGSVTSAVGDHGLYAVFVLMAVDAVFPAASELVMVYAGAVAAGAFGASVKLGGTTFSEGGAAFAAMALAGTLGYLAGSAGGWAIGRYGGRPLLERRGRWFHLGGDRLDRAERWFDRWDDLAVVLGRVTPLVRSFVSIPAGVFRMGFWRYLVLTLVGSAAWAFAFAGIGWALGRSYERFHHAFRFADYAIVAAVVALLAYSVIHWRRVRRAPGSPSTDTSRARRRIHSAGALDAAHTVELDGDPAAPPTSLPAQPPSRKGPTGEPGVPP
jgi:membrane protein DedA with SNARE-associated domain